MNTQMNPYDHEKVIVRSIFDVQITKRKSQNKIEVTRHGAMLKPNPPLHMVGK